MLHPVSSSIVTLAKILGGSFSHPAYVRQVKSMDSAPHQLILESPKTIARALGQGSALLMSLKLGLAAAVDVNWTTPEYGPLLNAREARPALSPWLATPASSPPCPRNAHLALANSLSDAAQILTSKVPGAYHVARKIATTQPALALAVMSRGGPFLVASLVV